MALNESQPLWSRTDFILADLIDATNTTSWLVANKDVEKRKRAAFPDPYPRPGVESKKSKKQISEADLIAFRERTRGA
jgi:hypothetical protein